MPTHLIAFVVTVALLAMLPGANNAAITRQTLAYGRRAGWLTVAGSSTGILIWAAAAAVGLSAVVLTNPHAFLAIRIGGAAVLGLLGVQTLWSLRRPHGPAEGSATVGATVGRKGRHSYAVGLATGLGNPKAGVFAVSLLPQFVTADGPVLASSIALGAIWALVSGAWFCGFVYVLDQGRARVTRPAFRRGMQAATGLSLLGLGVAVALGA
jgi:threonine/homoserine/homoserine lactone efflux protein